MKNKFLKVAQEGHFFDKHQKVLVAVSGGQDSMCLLECLLATREVLEIELGIAHVNYGLREESALEEQTVKTIAQANQIPFFSLPYTEKEFTEEKGRDFRYAFFKGIMEKKGYTGIVTAHHADDQTETVFMRILRGSRLQHLSGIPAIQPFGNGELIRPFLTFKKSELEASTYFEDSSNQSDIYLRNRIRNTYIPLLEKENPQFSNHLLQIGQESQYLYQALKDLIVDINVTQVSDFRKQTFSVQYFLLQLYLEKFPDLQLSKAQFEELLHIIRTKANYQHRLKDDYYFVKDYKEFSITKILPKTDVELEDYVIKSEGIFEYGNFQFSFNHSLPDATQIIFAKKDIPILLRRRESGDRILLNGLNKKISRYFIDEKIPDIQRNEALIIEQDGKVLGIADIVTSDLSISLKNDIMKDTLYIKMKE